MLDPDLTLESRVKRDNEPQLPQIHWTMHTGLQIMLNKKADAGIVIENEGIGSGVELWGIETGGGYES